MMMRLVSGFSMVVCLIGLYWGAPLPGAELASSQTRWLPDPALQPDPKIPTLEQVVGHDWAQDITSYVQMERYLKALVKAAPDRAALVPYGTTYEGRTLYYLIVAKPEHFQRREEIRAANLQLADPRTLPADRMRRVAAGIPTLIWLAYTIHGNETSGTEAALLTAYHLLADRRPETQRLLDHAMVLIDPLQNPDGHERFVNAYRENRGVFPDADPLATERAEPWPSGRFNHYLFDMNRDWFLQSQRESRAKVAAYLDWQPHTYVDAHEMGHNANYFFSPKGEPVNPFFLPQQTETLDQMARALAARFDEHGFAYTTREMFEAFYPGYGSSWPIFQGGVAHLWEQAGVRGLLVRRSDDLTLHFRDAVRHHYVSSLVAIEFSAANARRLVDEFYEARRSSIQLGLEGPVRDFFLLPGHQPQRATALAELLRHNGVQVQRVTKRAQVEATDIRTGQTGRRPIPADSYRVSVSQPAGRLVRVLLDRQVNLEPEFIQRQLDRNAIRFPDEIYDVTAWSLPLAFGVDCIASSARAEVATAPWDDSRRKGQVVGGPAKVVYLVPDHDAAIPALFQWLRQGLRVHVADRDFQVNEEEFPRGTFILRVAENSDKLHGIIEQAAQELGLRIVASDTGLVAAGAQLGGPHIKWIRPPKVAMLVDRPTSYAVGHTWYLFDQVWRYPVTRIAASNLGRFELKDYNVLVMPDGDWTGREAPTESEIARLRQWIDQGGTLILVKRAASWATQKPASLLAVERKFKPGEKPSADATREAAQEVVDACPGAFLRGNVFQEHWLTFGAAEPLDVFYRGDLILTPPEASKGRSLVTFAARPDILTSGFCWPQTLDVIAETPYLIHQPLGSGHLVAFTDDPNYRAMYPVSQRLFVNAVLFGPGY